MSGVQTSISLLALSVLVEGQMSSYLGVQRSVEAKVTKITEHGFWEGGAVERGYRGLSGQSHRRDAAACRYAVPEVGTSTR